MQGALSWKQVQNKETVKVRNATLSFHTNSLLPCLYSYINVIIFISMLILLLNMTKVKTNTIWDLQEEGWN